MLQARTCGGAVDEPEVEQARPDDGPDLVAGCGDRCDVGDPVVVHVLHGSVRLTATAQPAQRGRLRVDEPERVPRRRETGGLREPGLLRGAVPQALGRRPGDHPDGLRERVQGPQLVHAGHGHDHLVVEPRDVPRRRQRLLPRRAASLAATELLARARDRHDVPIVQPQPAQCVVHRVGDNDVEAQA